jgi:hypothetical protein
MEKDRKRYLVAPIGLAVMLAVLTVSCAGVPSPKDHPEYTWITQHTYDNVFQASQEACARRRELVTASDKDKGTIRCEGHSNHGLYIFEVHIKALNTKPETQITFVPIEKPFGMLMSAYDDLVRDRYLSEVQAVLAGVQVAPSGSGTASNPPASPGGTGVGSGVNDNIRMQNESIQRTDDRIRDGH